MTGKSKIPPARSRRRSIAEYLGRSEKRWEAFHRQRDVLEASELVREMRTRAGLNQTELAKLCQSTQSYISELENGTGKQGPTFTMLKRIARACRADLSIAILGGYRASSQSFHGHRPLHDRVLIRRAPSESESAGGIIIPETAQDAPSEGEVLAVGSGTKSEEGRILPLDVSVGDRVLFGKWSGAEVRIDDEELLIVNESDILGVIEFDLVDDISDERAGKAA